jgi:hypothetical protein
MMVEKHVKMEDNLMSSEDYKSVNGFSHKGDKHFFHKEDKFVGFLEDVSPWGIEDFPKKERAKDLVSHFVHIMCYGL